MFPAFGLKAEASTLTCISSLLACPEDFRFASPHNRVRQFFKILLTLDRQADRQEGRQMIDIVYPIGSVSFENPNTGGVGYFHLIYLI